jgi:hypothetical protein
MVNQLMADEHFNADSYDTCADCGMQFKSDDEILDNDELCPTCALHKIDRDACAVEFGDAARA